MPLQATIAICTWNRAKLLDQTLARLRDLQVPAGIAWEIVVVNNRCSDETDQVLEKHASGLPLRRVFEERQGLSHARNAASLAARGDLILWTDDDVLVDRKWLAEMTTAARQEPRASFFGGPIEPWFESQPPDWLVRNWQHFSSAYAIRDFGPEALELSETRLPFGANYAVRRDIQRQFPYDARLGRTGTGAIGGEETQVLRRMLAAGHRGAWVHEAKVQHFLPSERLTVDYLRSYFQGVGQTELARLHSDQSAGKLSRTWLSGWQATLGEAWFRLVDGMSPLRGKTWARALIRSCVHRGRVPLRSLALSVQPGLALD